MDFFKGDGFPLALVGEAREKGPKCVRRVTIRQPSIQESSRNYVPWVNRAFA